MFLASWPAAQVARWRVRVESRSMHLDRNSTALVVQLFSKSAARKRDWPHRRWLLADADAQGFHFAVEMAALEAEQLGGVADVVAGFFNLFEDVLALVGIAGLLQR